MIKNSADELYVGISKNPSERVIYHNKKHGASFTKRIPTFKLVFQEKQASLKKARQREMQIKKWRHDKKEQLIERFEQGLPTKIILR